MCMSGRTSSRTLQSDVSCRRIAILEAELEQAGEAQRELRGEAAAAAEAAAQERSELQVRPNCAHSLFLIVAMPGHRMHKYPASHVNTCMLRAAVLCSVWRFAYLAVLHTSIAASKRVAAQDVAA